MGAVYVIELSDKYGDEQKIDRAFKTREAAKQYIMSLGTVGYDDKRWKLINQGMYGYAEIVEVSFCDK